MSGFDRSQTTGPNLIDQQLKEVVKELEARHPGNAMCEQAAAESWEPNITIAQWIANAEKRL